MTQGPDNTDNPFLYILFKKKLIIQNMSTFQRMSLCFKI